MRPWLRGAIVSLPGIALFIAAMLALATVPSPSSGPSTCACPGPVCMCPAVLVPTPTYSPAGILWLIGAVIYLAAAFAVLRARPPRPVELAALPG